MADANTEDSDWEYEYSPTETTAFYIPIDLSNVPGFQALPNTDRRPGHPTLLKSRLKALEAARGQLPELQHTTTDDPHSHEQSTLGEVQMTGLHTHNPLLMYNGQMLSCHWAAAVGTDLFFVKHGAEGKGVEEPLRELKGVDLMGVGTAKLVAKVGRLRPKDELFEGEEQEELSNGGTVAAEKDTAMTDASVRPEPNEPGPAAASGTGPVQPDFLSKLNEAKIKRGERNRLLVAKTPEGSHLVAEALSAAEISKITEPTEPVDDVSMSGT